MQDGLYLYACKDYVLGCRGGQASQGNNIHVVGLLKIWRQSSHASFLTHFDLSIQSSPWSTDLDAHVTCGRPLADQTVCRVRIVKRLAYLHTQSSQASEEYLGPGHLVHCTVTKNIPLSTKIKHGVYLERICCNLQLCTPVKPVIDFSSSLLPSNCGLSHFSP